MDEDLASGAVKAIVAWFGLKGLDRLLGPTLDLYGEGLKDLAAAGNRNLKAIFEKALRKVGDDLRIDAQVPPRIFQRLLLEAPYCEDELVQEYLAGILASSRTLKSGDHSLHHMALIGRLPALQIRMHYLFYRLIYECYRDSGLRMNSGRDREKMAVLIAFFVFRNFISDFVGDEDDSAELENVYSFHDEAINNLYQEGLIGVHAYGSPSYFKEVFGAELFFATGGTLVTPSSRGAELFMRCHGIKNKILPNFFDQDYTDIALGRMNITQNCTPEILDYKIEFIAESKVGLRLSEHFRCPRSCMLKLAEDIKKMHKG
jgi:hypothetical protein